MGELAHARRRTVEEKGHVVAVVGLPYLDCLRTVGLLAQGLPGHVVGSVHHKKHGEDKQVDAD